MAKFILIFCFFNFYSALAFRKESIQLPENEDKSTRDVNLKGSRDGKRKFILIRAYGHGSLMIKHFNLSLHDQSFIFSVFSLFSIVQFKNDACTSSQTLSNT